MQSQRKKVVVLALTHIHRDARVQRQIAGLAIDHEVVVVGYGQLGAVAGEHIAMVPLPAQWSALVRYPLVLACTVVGRVLPKVGYWGWDSALRDHRAALAAAGQAKPDVIVANDWYTLPIAVRAQQSTGAKIVADLHEYSPLHWQSRKVWMALIAPMVDFHLRQAASRIATAVTVNQTIADRYEREYGIRCGVVRNIPDAQALATFRATDPQQVRLVHHGNATRERSLHLMIEALAQTDARFSLYLYLIEIDRGYVAELRALADRLAPGRVHFEQPMRPAEIVSTITCYDMGIFILPPLTFNYHAALPNKFFEFLFAGLAVCVGPSPEMAKILEEHACGVVVPSFDPREVAQHLNRLTTAQIDAMKQRSLKACASFDPKPEMDVMRRAVSEALAR